ncbi:integrase arm-type DNA-binding domain-containing protein [Brenneria populi]|uniref:integrase arm-type DNA-binding domain-containing protein n=1 Tax=Brenneria populi TaxID=1505588 RepID=UPI003898DEFE
MAVLTRPLSASEVQKAKPADKDYELFDGQGLTLFVRTNGKKIWRFRYKRPGSTARTTITLGHYQCAEYLVSTPLKDDKLS